jgi:hypothetical protein
LLVIIVDIEYTYLHLFVDDPFEIDSWEKTVPLLVLSLSLMFQVLVSFIDSIVFEIGGDCLLFEKE